MNDRQREYCQKLLAWRAELLDEANQTIANLSTESLHKPDQMDLAQIESAERLIYVPVTGNVNCCRRLNVCVGLKTAPLAITETDEPISLAVWKPAIASMSLAAGTAQRMERVHRDD